jgi:hypothetical protein
MLFQRIIFRAAAIFVAAFALTVPTDSWWLPHPGRWLAPIFEPLARWSGEAIFGITHPFEYHFISDATGLYLHAFNLFCISFMAAGVYSLTKKHQPISGPFQYGCYTFIRYYLALQLLVYGCNKVFKAQFYLPEPNTLYTPFGQLHADINYWSVMGLSRPYSIFLGMAEAVAAMLLLFRRTYIAGAFLSVGILLNVWVLNMAFDISVKLLSLFLLLLSLLLIASHLKRIFNYLAFQQTTPLQLWRPAWFGSKRLAYRFLKTTTIGLLFCEGLVPYLRSGNLNDDAQTRPFLHGAWQVDSFRLNDEERAPLLTDDLRWKKVFVHRQHYFIVQGMNDSMYSCELVYDTLNQKLYITPEGDSLTIPLQYRLLNDSTLLLDGPLYGGDAQLRLHALPWHRLPALQKEFSWTVDN